MSRDNLLIVADSEHDANMLYVVGMFVPDPFIYLRLRNKCHVVMNDLEIERARKFARHCRVLSLSRYQKRLEDDPRKPAGFPQVIREILRERRIKKIFVPANFPFGVARDLRRLGVKIKLKDGAFFPEREFKSADEVKKISAALMMAEVGLAEGIQVLKNSKVAKDRKLLYRTAPLTADRLRATMHTAIFQAGGLPGHTIVAGGRQACNPHEQGNGVLRANEPIIIDIFPRSQKTGYFGDITRTIVKGRASEAVRRLYHTVAFGQQIAFEKLRHGATGQEVHQGVQAFFKQQGYPTGRKNGCPQGFFHGTGHGLGLEIHEAPRLSAHSPDILQSSQVVTVEPGLYYLELGGIRLEDVALVTRNGPKNLTKFEKTLEV
jgi:Xaa-Pro aminopeptidase